jgi:hypothetical protein
VSPPINCGIYLISTRLYEEFGLSRRGKHGPMSEEEGGGTTPFNLAEDSNSKEF